MIVIQNSNFIIRYVVKRKQINHGQYTARLKFYAQLVPFNYLLYDKQMSNIQFAHVSTPIYLQFKLNSVPLNHTQWNICKIFLAR